MTLAIGLFVNTSCNNSKSMNAYKLLLSSFLFINKASSIDSCDQILGRYQAPCENMNEKYFNIKRSTDSSSLSNEIKCNIPELNCLSPYFCIKKDNYQMLISQSPFSDNENHVALVGWEVDKNSDYFSSQALINDKNGEHRCYEIPLKNRKKMEL